jgi:hypothetical protein
MFQSPQTLLPHEALIIFLSMILSSLYGNQLLRKFDQEHVIIRELKPERGDILDIFSKLEFLVNELIQAKLLSLFSPDASFLEDVLENVDLFSRIRLPQQWELLETNYGL